MDCCSADVRCHYFWLQAGNPDIDPIFLFQNFTQKISENQLFSPGVYIFRHRRSGTPPGLPETGREGSPFPSNPPKTAHPSCRDGRLSTPCDPGESIFEQLACVIREPSLPFSIGTVLRQCGDQRIGCFRWLRIRWRRCPIHPLICPIHFKIPNAIAQFFG